MIIRFDALSRFERPLFHLCNPGAKYDNGVLTRAIGILSDTSDEEVEFNFNATSTLSLRVYKRKYDDPEQDKYFQSLYKKIQNRRLIFIDDIGFFVIIDVADGYQDGMSFKDVEAESCEAEMYEKKLPYIEDNTYQFDELLSTVLGTTPIWEAVHVDAPVSERYRTFEDVDTDQNVLSFLLEDMQDAYECIFLFDPIERKIRVYDQNTYVHETDVHLTRDDIINSVEVSTTSEDTYTAISVYGDGDLTIAAVNPLGTTTMYNFDYFLDWMSPELSAKVKEWQEKIAYHSNVSGNTPDKDNYPKLGEQYAAAYTDYINSGSQLEMLNVQLSMYQRCYDNISVFRGNSLVSSYNDVIEAAGGEPIPENIEAVDELQAVVKGLIDKAKEDIAAEEANNAALDQKAKDIWNQMLAISQTLAIDKYFSVDEYEELSFYISEGSYTDKYVVITDSMTYSEQFEQLSTLYARAVKQLEKISKPTEEFSIGTESFLFQEAFKAFSDQLETGCIINVEVDDDDIAPLFLSGMNINFDDLELDFTFGNRLCRFDPKAMFQDVLGDVRKSANTIEYMRDLLHPIKDGAIEQFREYLADSRNLTKSMALQAVNQSVVIDDTGYTGKKILGDYDFDPRQVKLVNNNLLFTKDAWDTCDVAIGELTFVDDNGETINTMGVNAHALIGDIIIGSELHIWYNDDDGQRTRLDVGVNGLTSEVSKKVGNDEIISAINQTAEQIKILAAKIQLEGLVTANDNFKILEDGSMEAANAKFSGDILGGTIGIGGSGAASTRNFYVDSNGNVTMKGSINLSGSSNITWPSSGAPTTRDRIYTAMLSKHDGDGLYSEGGLLCINATAIKTGILDAEHVKIAGTYGGLIQGNGMAAGGVVTNGVKLYGPNGENGTPYIIVSDTGIRLQDTSDTSFFISKGYAEVHGGLTVKAAGSQGGNLNLDGSLFVQKQFAVRYAEGNDQLFTFGMDSHRSLLTGRAVFIGIPSGGTDSISLSSDGGIYGNKPYTYSSDRRLKRDIQDLPDAYVKLLDLVDPKMFRYKSDPVDAPLHWGYLAQDIETAMAEAGLCKSDMAALSEFTGNDGETYMGIAYTELIPLLHLKLLGLQSEVKKLKEETRNDT